LLPDFELLLVQEIPEFFKELALVTFFSLEKVLKLSF
jgi:hypothetical protein